MAPSEISSLREPETWHKTARPRLRGGPAVAPSAILNEVCIVQDLTELVLGELFEALDVEGRLILIGAGRGRWLLGYAVAGAPHQVPEVEAIDLSKVGEEIDVRQRHM